MDALTYVRTLYFNELYRYKALKASAPCHLHSYNHDVLCKIIKKLFKKHFIPCKRWGGGGGTIKMVAPMDVTTTGLGTFDLEIPQEIEI